jgi:hypothetical protein
MIAMKCAIISIVSSFFIVVSVRAGDAVVVGYNADGVWTAVTYYRSSTPREGRDYKTSTEACAEALRDLRARSATPAARTDILSTSDATEFVAVARGKQKSGKDLNVAGSGKSQPEADEAALAKLNKEGATLKQKIVYRYFSYGSDSK